MGDSGTSRKGFIHKGVTSYPAALENIGPYVMYARRLLTLSMKSRDTKYDQQV